jgi:adenylate kinase family enzyme
LIFPSWDFVTFVVMIFSVERIVILGCAGSGKTTLARQLGERTGAPIISLDAIWPPHGDEKDVPAFRALMKYAHAGDEWISDGNFAVATFDIRLPRATMVIWLEDSKLSCVWRVITRVFKPGEAHGITRLGKVLAFIWNFDRVNRPRIEAMRLSHGPNVPVRRLFGSRDVAAFLSSYGNSGNKNAKTDDR